MWGGVRVVVYLSKNDQIGEDQGERTNGGLRGIGALSYQEGLGEGVWGVGRVGWGWLWCTWVRMTRSGRTKVPMVFSDNKRSRRSWKRIRGVRG